MSRGPGVWQRRILDALDEKACVFVWDLLPQYPTRAQRFAYRRAARRLADRGLVTLESMGGEVWVTRRQNPAEVK